MSSQIDNLERLLTVYTVRKEAVLLSKTVDLLTRKNRSRKERDDNTQRRRKTAKKRLLEDSTNLHSKKRKGIIEQDC